MKTENERIPPADAGGCCLRDTGDLAKPASAATPILAAARSGADRADTVPIPGGRAEVGTDRPVFPPDGEGPARFVKVAPFLMDAATVTNARFAHFVDETGFVTEAERFGWSFVFDGNYAGDAESLQRVTTANWWCKADGAYWKHPEGPASDLEGRADHPVVHISQNDALAFAAWAGGRLPTEVEWEHAARGGKPGTRYPWGDQEPDDSDFTPCNIWQGTFPNKNLGADGYLTTAPARSFEPNGYGLYNVVGNVWEWSLDPFRVRSLKRGARELNAVAEKENRRVLKGGSFMCHRSYCHRYRIAARIGNTPDTSASHIGFRLVYDKR